MNDDTNDDMNDEQFEQYAEAVEETADEIADKLTCAQEVGIEPNIMMFRLMYPLVTIPSGSKCQNPDCECGGQNDEMTVICTAIN